MLNTARPILQVVVNHQPWVHFKQPAHIYNSHFIVYLYVIKTENCFFGQE